MSIKPTLPKKFNRRSIKNALSMWADETNNHPFTVVDIKNSGVLDRSHENSRGHRVPRGINITTNSISAVCGSLERQGWLGLVHYDQWNKKGRCKQWRLSGWVTV
tara:strand:+ start:3619 stop:3933 length:315 start_codon:yes stop_codon:yes gene_type:complete